MINDTAQLTVNNSDAPLTDVDEPTHVISQQLVSKPGCSETRKALDILRSLGKRFIVVLTEEDEAKQLRERDQVLKRLDLADFHPETEKELEDWADLAARRVNRHRVCIGLFQDAWEAASASLYADIVGNASPDNGHESLVDQVARNLFPESDYVGDVEQLLFLGERQTSVVAAKNWMKMTSERFLRLSERWNYKGGLGDSRLREVALRCLPEVVARKVRKDPQAKTLETVWELAAFVEQDLRRRNGKLPEPLGAFPAEFSEPPPRKRRAPDATRPNVPTTSPCRGCGVVGAHWYKDCPKREHRCATCHRLGHIASGCPNWVKADATGKPKVVVQSGRRGVTVQNKEDGTQRGKLDTATEILELLRQLTIAKSEKERKRRDRKKTETGWKPKRTPRDHPVAFADEESDSGSDDSSEGTSSDAPALSGAFLALDTLDRYTSVPFDIAGCTVPAIPDTGARRSLCSVDTARALRLTPTSKRVRFRGFGNSSTRVCEPTTLKWMNQEISVTFHAVDQPDFPTLIGRHDLIRLGVHVDPMTLELIARQPEPCAFATTAPDEDREAVQRDMPQLEAKPTKQERRNEVTELLDAHTQHLTPGLQKSVKDLFHLYEEAWLNPTSGEARVPPVHFEVAGPPIRTKLRPLVPELRAELDKQLEKMLEEGILHPSKSAWGSAPVFVRKKNREWRLCLDYRLLNKQLVADAYPLPSLWDNLQRAAHHRYYTCLDLHAAFWSIPLDKKSRQYTAITTHKGTFEFSVLPFGIKNSPACFQRCMDSIFGNLADEGVLTYIDDIVIFTNDIATMQRLIREVLRRCTEAKLYLNLTKSEICKNEVKLLGHIIGQQGIMPSPTRVNSVRSARPPRDKAELRSFLGAANYLRRFVPQFSGIAAPLYELLKKNVTYDWTEERQEAFEELKDALSAQVLLSAPQGYTDFALMTDASDVGIGAVLCQVQDKELVVIEFASKRLTPAERRWDVREREAFAIKWALGHYHDYLKVARVIILTDHESLRWMDKAQSGKVQRWALFMQQFNFEVTHIDGETNVMADWMSRSIEDDVDQDATVETMAIPAFPALMERPTNTTSTSLVPQLPTQEMIKAALTDINLADAKATYLRPDGLRYDIRNDKLFVPDSLRSCFLYWFHCSRYGGHCGVTRTLRRMRKLVNWPGMAKDTREYVANCYSCIRRRAPPSASFINVLSRPAPFQLISLDFVGPRQVGNRRLYYLVVIDHASRFIVTGATESTTSSIIVKLLKERWVSIFQAPNVVLTDRGQTFLSQEFRKYITEELGAYLMHTSPYYPQGNGVNEAAHSGLEKSIACAIHQGEESFDAALADATAVHNATPHVANGESPFFMLFGCEPFLPGWQQLIGRDDNLRRWNQKMRRQMELVRRNVQDSGLKEVDESIAVGDWVIFYQSPYEKSKDAAKPLLADKYLASWSLPAKVLRIADKVIHCCLLGIPVWVRQVPVNQVRVLKGPVPHTLAKLNQELLEKDSVAPGFVRHRQVVPQPVGASSWTEVIEEVVSQRKKRLRPPPEVRGVVVRPTPADAAPRSLEESCRDLVTVASGIEPARQQAGPGTV